MHCLVVDPNLAFATLLSEELVRLGHKVITCVTAAEAYAASQTRASSADAPQLALLDMALPDPGALTLGHQLRAVLPAIRLVLIPMMGEEPVLGADAPSIQGVLPKPFFLPELPERIAAAFNAPLPDALISFSGAPPGLNLAAPLLDADNGASDELDLSSLDWTSALDGVAGNEIDDDSLEGDGADDAQAAGSVAGAGDDLSWLNAFATPPARDITAEVEVVRPATVPVPVDVPPVVADPVVTGDAPRTPVARGISRRALRVNQERIMNVIRELVNEVGADAVLLTGETGVLAWAGTLDEADVASISDAVLHSRRASEEVARILGREQLLFEQSMAGGTYLLYALNVHDAILAVTVSGPASLGLLRHRTRSAGESIAELCTIG